MRPAAAGQAANGGLMRGSTPAPLCKGRYPLANPSGPRSSYFLVYQTQLSIRGQGASMPLPARLESSKRCYWLCQTSGWNEWAGPPLAATPAKFIWRATHAKPKTQNPKPKTQNPKPKTQNPKPKTQNPKPKKIFRPQAAKRHSDCCGFSRPNRASPPLKKSGSHARRDAGQGVTRQIT